MRRAMTNEFVSHDGTHLFYRAWPAEGEARRAVVLFHRGHEHSGRWQEVVDKLDLPDTAMFAWDARGHGLSPGQRGYAPGFGTLVRDADAFVRHVSHAYGIPMENIVVLAHSVGSVIAATWVHDYAPPIRALVLGSPALRVRLYVPFAIPLLRLWLRLKGKAFVRSYVKGRLLTRDPEKQRAYDEDPLITPAIAVNILLGLRDAGTRLIRDAGAIRVPTLVLSSGADFVVDRETQRTFFDRLGSDEKAMHVFPGMLHDTFNERDNHLPIAMARQFIRDAFSRHGRPPTLLAADRDGPTLDEYRALATPLPPWSPAALGYGAARLLLATVGRLSDGIRLGWRRGFDSGAMLDYVYRNRARGITPLGRLIDRAFLDSPGWRGIRERRVLLQRMIDRAILTTGIEGRPARIADIAAGHGRYVLEVLARRPEPDTEAVLSDFDPGNLEAGRRLAGELGLDRVAFVLGNAFDPGHLRRLEPRPTIAVVSGLYELFPDNAPVAASLGGLAEAVEPGGYLVYTNQPWHPQIAFIARVLTSHRDGRRWVMRRRTQAEMDQLVAAAGFEKIDQATDEGGLFTVSLARRRHRPVRVLPAALPAAAEG